MKVRTLIQPFICRIIPQTLSPRILTAVFAISSVLLPVSVPAQSVPDSAGPVSTSNRLMVRGFVYAEEILDGVLVDLRYYGSNNFVGAPVDGYEAPRLIMSRRSAEALVPVQKELQSMGLTLKIFDAYRPQQAVDHFVRWSLDTEDTRTKTAWYPLVEKENLFDDGYIAERSGHSRGSAVDLTVADARFPHQELDMGTPFDFFDPSSGAAVESLSAQQRANRLLLRSVMTRHGFKPYRNEWWHFSLIDEPFPNTYFNFPVR